MILQTIKKYRMKLLLLTIFSLSSLSISLSFGSELSSNPIYKALWSEVYNSPLQVEAPAAAAPPTTHLPKKAGLLGSSSSVGSSQVGGGESKVEEALRKNREFLKAKRAKEKEESEQASENASEDDFLKKAKSDVNKTYSNWKSDVEETYARWDRERKAFLDRISDYKDNLAPLIPPLPPAPPAPAPGPSPSKKLLPPPPIIIPKKKLVEPVKPPVREREKEQEVVPKHTTHLVLGSLDTKVKDQGKRSTCAAFAAIHGMEIVLKGKKQKESDLSEEYFYHSSRPDCQNEPCTTKGSWVVPGFLVSQRSSNPNIPLEENCPYNASQVAQNETHFPLPGGCKEGFAKITSYSELQSLNDVVDALKSDFPVIAGFSLSENFYTTTGLVPLTREESALLGKSSLDSHAKGHALLIIGYMELPRESTQGNYCFVVANSWGEGYGKGGHACLTEKWMIAHRLPIPFIAIKDVETLSL